MRNMNDILRQAQVMQNKIAKVQQELGEHSYEATSGGGMVKAEVSGKQELRKITIDPKALEGGDVGGLRGVIGLGLDDDGRLRARHDPIELPAGFGPRDRKSVV